MLDMKRRELITVLASAAAWPLAASCWSGEASHVMLIWLSGWSAMLSAPGAPSATVSMVSLGVFG